MILIHRIRVVGLDSVLHGASTRAEPIYHFNSDGYVDLKNFSECVRILIYLE